VRLSPVMDMLKNYGVHAQRVIPHLEEAVRYFENDEHKKGYPKKNSLLKAEIVRQAIKEIKASKQRPPLIRISE